MPRPYKQVFGVQTYKDGELEKSKWTLIGVAFENRDGSLNIQLNYFPIDGKLHVRNKDEGEGPE